MIFGFFTSIIPYLIAGGIYLIYLVLSFMQPAVDTIPEEHLQADVKVKITDEFQELTEPEKSFYYEDSFRKDVRLSHSPKAALFFEYINPFYDSLSNSPPDYSIPGQFVNTIKIHSGLFFRPPPMC